ncbi:hypothetical protein [Streptomyces graminilatus]|uniref:hypothetical protein n=1 Tax=Streptomyces graminilatus TaxID=1464070 RepID=UPI0006E300D2|nr:hypothetical protein [Streptomyces graminilatus]
MPLHATRVRADTATATVVSASKEVADWVLRYFGPWWNATPVAAPAENAGVTDGGGLLLADADPARLQDLHRQVADLDTTEVTYAGTRTLVAEPEPGAIYAVQPDVHLAYYYTPATSRLVIVGAETQPVAVAAARLTRELVRGQLLHAGFHILHASAVVRGGRALLSFGPKGAGKTTTALLLARAGFELLANDRVFIRTEDGTVRILPWPSAAAIGLGLLDSIGLYDAVRERVLAGEQLHPTQHQRVTDALHAGGRTPLRNDQGKELKPQFFPDQLPTWLGIPLATGAHAAGLLFPQITAGIPPHVLDARRNLTEEDFFTAQTEDRYPDIFRLTPARAVPTTELADQLTLLPNRSVNLSHDVAVCADLLVKTADDLLAA